MTDAEQREAARQFVNRWMGKGKDPPCSFLILSHLTIPAPQKIPSKLYIKHSVNLTNKTFTFILTFSYFITGTGRL